MVLINLLRCIEIWKIIDKFPNYSISNYGRIKRIIGGKGSKINGLLKPRINRNGYLNVDLYNDNIKKYIEIHRLVLETFNPIDNMNILEANHEDGNKRNNYIRNLEWMTHSENIKHDYDNGLKALPKGELNPNSKLTEKDVIEIRIDLKEGILTQKEIGEKFGVSQVTISRIKLNKNWRK